MSKTHKMIICFVCKKAKQSRLFIDKEGNKNLTCNRCMRRTSSFEEKSIERIREIENKEKYDRRRRSKKVTLPKSGVWYWKGKPMEKSDVQAYLNR